MHFYILINLSILYTFFTTLAIVWIYLFFFYSNFEHNNLHISKRYKQCGISRLASKLKYKVCDIGLRKLDHAESITVKRKENHYNHRLNLKSRGSQLTILVYAVVAMQAKVTY